MKFKVGDRVRIVKEKNGGPWNTKGEMDIWLGKIMTINAVMEGYYNMKEDMESSDGKLYPGWSWHEEMIEGLVVENKIVITTDGKITLAKLYEGKKVIRSAEAKCNPTDTFNFEVGAKLAMERLMPTEVKEEVSVIPSIEVGDTVRVIDSGAGYTTYSKWFKFANVDIDIAAKYRYGVSVEEGTIGEVLVKHEHSTGSAMIYLIEDRKRHIYLIGEDGIVKEDK